MTKQTSRCSSNASDSLNHLYLPPLSRCRGFMCNLFHATLYSLCVVTAGSPTWWWKCCSNEYFPSRWNCAIIAQNLQCVECNKLHMKPRHNTRFLGNTVPSSPTGISIGSAIFAGFTVVYTACSCRPSPTFILSVCQSTTVNSLINAASIHFM